LHGGEKKILIFSGGKNLAFVFGKRHKKKRKKEAAISGAKNIQSRTQLSGRIKAAGKRLLN